jgi:hypothetical protein
MKHGTTTSCVIGKTNVTDARYRTPHYANALEMASLGLPVYHPVCF